MRESDSFFYHIFEKTTDNLHRIGELATKVPGDLHSISEHVFSANALVAGVGVGILGYALVKEKLWDKRSSSAESSPLSPVPEQADAPKNLRIPLDADSIVIWDSSGRSDVERIETETQIIFAYPDGSDPSVIELGSRVHPNELSELVVIRYQKED